MKSSALFSLSPLDGRYASSLAPLARLCSEAGLMRYRVQVEVEYLIALAADARIPEVGKFSATEQALLRGYYQNFSTRDAERIKAIEATTKHDVKAVEYFIKQKLQRTSLRTVQEFVHFGLTSEDINNLAYSLMLRDSVQQVYLPAVRQLTQLLKHRARYYAGLPMLSLTHGQPATPTTLGKEYMVYAARLTRQQQTLKQLALLGKFGGATGNWAALVVAYPKVNWLQFSQRFVQRLGLEFNPATTQIESHDRIAEVYQAIARICTIIKDLDGDMWLYISRGVFTQRNVAGEIGSSAMPHKINPIYFENSEGNCGLAVTLLQYLAEKLPVSRLQRDLTDSTVLRNQGSALGHAYLAVQNVLQGLERIEPNRDVLAGELDAHWEVLAEAIQTVLRRLGKPTPYEQLKKLTRGQQLTRQHLHDFIDTLDIPTSEQQNLKKLTPGSYTGLSNQVATMSLK